MMVPSLKKDQNPIKYDISIHKLFVHNSLSGGAARYIRAENITAMGHTK
jgi:hypothetical protein